MAIVLIGIDDTDNPTSRGTGWLARMLYDECARRGHKPLSVTRHQFPLDERIPYTSHNSGACVAVEAHDEQSLAFAFDFIAERSAQGSDPGLCVVRCDTVGGEVIEFSKRVTSEVVEKAEALETARRAGIDLRALSGSGLGVIGALASAGLHAEGNDGRFIQLPGLRDLPDRTGREELNRLGIRLDHRGGRTATPDDVYETMGWVRPRLVGGEAVLPVQWNEEKDAWIPVERKRSRPLE